ncbi:MAG: hypothetical protein ACREN8_04460 [Candidatus Dormibacteraceae bacterium]
MRNLRIWARLLGLKDCVVEGVEMEGKSVVVKVHGDGRSGFGFHSSKPIIGLVMLSFGALQLNLPGRSI